MKISKKMRQVRQVRVKLVDALSTGTGPKAAFQLRQGVWGIEAHLCCDAVYTSGKDNCANLMAGELTQQTAVDPDGQRLNRLIRRKRRQIAANKILVPITLSLSLAAVLVAIVTIVTVLLSTGVFS